MNKDNQLWCYSLDGENYANGTFASEKIALAKAQKEMAEAQKVMAETAVSEVKFLYIAKAEPQQNHSFFPDGSDIIEHMANQADDVGGDHVNNYPDVSEEAEKELTTELHALLEKWCEKHGVSPSFYLVSEPMTYNAKTMKRV
jgi:hypothetical protein